MFRQKRIYAFTLLCALLSLTFYLAPVVLAQDPAPAEPAPALPPILSPWAGLAGPAITLIVHWAKQNAWVNSHPKVFALILSLLLAAIQAFSGQLPDSQWTDLVLSFAVTVAGQLLVAVGVHETLIRPFKKEPYRNG